VSGEFPDRQRELMDRVFHLVSQPITALQCSLELALNMQDDIPQCRTLLHAALENCERLRCRLSLAREIADTADLAESATVELRSVLQEALSEVAPLFDGMGPAPRLECDEALVPGERSRLLRAFLYVLQHLSGSSAVTGYTPEVQVERNAELIEVHFLRFVLRENSNQDYVRSQLQVAKATFESAGGGLIFYCFPGNDAFVRVFLRAPQAQLELYEEAVKTKPATSAIGTAAAFPQVS